MNDATDNAKAQADAQMRSIREMVAALDVDYDRLAELRECANENRATVTAYQEKMDDWQANADASEELEELAELESQAGDCESRDDAEERVQQDALSVEVRSDWRATGDDHGDPSEFRIVLCTGGPHVQIRGELSQGEPSRAWLEYQDWGTPMTERVNLAGDQDALLAYARCFYFGE